MQIGIFILAIVCSPLAVFGQDCSSCHSGIKGLGEYLTGPEKIEQQKALFKKELCTVEGDVEECRNKVDLYWPSMAKAIFTFQETPKDICSATSNACIQSLTDCTSCFSLLDELKFVFSQPDFVKSTGSKMAGFLYCDGLTDKEPCVIFVQQYGARAMSIFGTTLVATNKGVCSNILKTNC